MHYEKRWKQVLNDCKSRALLSLFSFQTGQHQSFQSSRMMEVSGSVETTKSLSTKQPSWIGIQSHEYNDLFASLAGGKTFSKLDLSHAYQQIQLDKKSRQYVTVNTHRGLFQYTRLPFGVSSAPSIFQRVMENLLQGVPRVCVYLDDILITGHTEAEHLKNLGEVCLHASFSGLPGAYYQCGRFESIRGQGERSCECTSTSRYH